MNINMLSADSVEQPWWRVRPHLIVTLALLIAVCVSLWAETPVRRWMVQQIVRAEMPNLPLFAQAGR